MQQRVFYVALGVPREADPESITVAYRKVVTRYRRVLESLPDTWDEPTEPLLSFHVLRTYSERRHNALFDEPEPLSSDGLAEVDRYFGGFVPEALTAAKARPAGKNLYVELRLSPDNAKVGGLFPVHIPVIKRCRACDGAAPEPGLVCPICHGSGQTTEDRMIEVTVPPGVKQGQVARIAMEDVGLGHTDLLVQVLVG